MELVELHEAQYYARTKSAREVYSIYRQLAEREWNKIFKLDTRYWETHQTNIASLYFDFPEDVDSEAPIRIVKSFVKKYNVPFTSVQPDDMSLSANDVIVGFVEKKNVMEAKYAGSYSVDDIYPSYKRLADALMYNWRSPVRDAAARTKLVKDRVAASIEFVMKDDIPLDQQIRYLKKLIKSEKLPYTSFNQLPGSGNYFEIIYAPHDP